MVTLLLPGPKLLLSVILLVLVRILDASLVLTMVLLHAQNVMLVITSRPVLAPNVVLVLGQKLTHRTNALLVMMAIPLLLAQKLLPTVKLVIKRMLDVSLALQLLLANAQTGVRVML